MNKEGKGSLGNGMVKEEVIEKTHSKVTLKFSSSFCHFLSRVLMMIVVKC
jgi:hypothetical protein